jgi:hypothetical protein
LTDKGLIIALESDVDYEEIIIDWSEIARTIFENG